MTHGIQQADVCIVCALAEEADAVEQVVSEHCQTAFAAGTTDDGYFVYRYTTIPNNKHEQLTLLLFHQTRPGPVFTALDLRLLLKTFQPRFVAMSGICAGDKRYLHLGDLVVAEHAYHFEEGKVTRDEIGTLVHQPDLQKSRCLVILDNAEMLLQGGETGRSISSRLRGVWSTV